MELADWGQIGQEKHKGRNTKGIKTGRKKCRIDNKLNPSSQSATSYTEKVKESLRSFENIILSSDSMGSTRVLMCVLCTLRGLERTLKLIVRCLFFHWVKKDRNTYILM